MYCKKCGKELEDNATFCQFCGQKQSEEVEENIKRESGDVSDKKLILMGVIVAVVILAVIAVVKLVGKGGKDTDVEKTLSEIEETVEEQNVENAIQTNTEKAKEEKNGKTEGENGDIAEDMTENAESENTDNVQEDVKPVVQYMKIGDCECWYDEDGDLVKANNTGIYSSVNIQYVTDAEGNKVYGDRMQMYIEEQPVHIISASDGSIPQCYNVKGHLIQNVHGEQDDGGFSLYEYVYDGENRLSKVSREEDGDQGYFTGEVSFAYSEGGNQVTASSQEFSHFKGEDDSDSWYLKSIFAFNDEKMISYVSEGPGINWSEEWEYDTSRNIIREKEDYNGRITEYCYQYDKNGNEIGCERNRENDNWTSESQYDENGRLIRVEAESNGGRDIEDYQYDQNGKQTKYTRSMERWAYDEEGSMTQHTLTEINQVYEYDEEGKLISYAYLNSVTGGDVVSFDSRYLYDEHGRISEIDVDGETAVTVSYNEDGMPEKIDSVMEVHNNAIWWQLIEDLLPMDLLMDLNDYSFLGDYRNKDITIEYR